MTLDEAIYARRSIRKYSEIKVGLDKIKEIITAGMWAPTACNKQEYRFVYLDDKELINAIYALGAAHFISETRQAILVLYDNRIDNVEYKDHIQSGSAVIQNMLLKATELNVGTCWVCNLPSKRKLKKLLEIPSYYDPIALITFGYFEKAPQPMKRKHAVEDIMFVNKFEIKKDMASQKSSSQLFIKKFLRSIYIRLPKSKFLLKLAEKFEKKF